jgi:hypothetical protein
MWKIPNILAAYFYCAYREGVEAIWYRLATKFHTQGVVTCILHCVIYAERSISIVFNVDVQVTEINIEKSDFTLLAYFSVGIIYGYEHHKQKIDVC